MPGNAGDNFHQDHKQTDDHSHHRNKTFVSRRTYTIVSRTSGQPSDCGSHRTNFGNWHENGIAEKHACSGGQPDAKHGERRRLIARMHMAKTLVHQSAPSYREQHPAGRDEISVEHFEQRKHCRCKDYSHDPARSYGALKNNRGHEFFMGELLPWRNISNRRDHDGVEKNANHNRHPDSFEEPTGAEFRTSLFRAFYDRFKTRHKIRHDLHDQKYGYEWAMGKERRKIPRRPLRH